MQERKSDFVFTLLLVVGFAGCVLYEIVVGSFIGFDPLLELVIALSFGFFSFLYSYTFAVIGIYIIIYWIKDDCDHILHMLSIAILDVAILIQLIFWGVYRHISFLLIIGAVLVLFLLVIVVILLKREFMKD